jgi:hypothetical protein
MLTAVSRSSSVFGWFVSLSLALSGCGGSTSNEGSGGSGTGGGAGSGGSAGTAGAGGSGGSGGGCDYDGKHYEEGQTFPLGDGCNTCSCMQGGALACTGAYCPPGCVYGGQVYKPGDTYPAGDGCNTCTCDVSGQSVCTKLACAPICVYAGTEHKIGEEFPALDGCNTCVCTDQGVMCTDMACACNPDAEWWRKYVSKDPQACMTMKYMCPENTTPFQNSCGCGCEQDASCPPYIDCMPPAPDCDAMKKKCPFSGVAL